MWFTLLFALLNLPLSFFGTKVLRLPGFDLTPAAIILCAWHGENVFVAALLLTASYAVFSLTELRLLWLTLPLTIGLGYLALAVHNAIALIILYHVIAGVAALLLGLFGVRYALFVVVNASLSFALVRIAAFLGV